MAPRPGTRNEPSRVHERPPDPAEASRTPLVDPRAPEEGEDPKHRFSHQADEVDPTSDSDPYADAESDDDGERPPG
ncbi:hypothetical protein [Conexibacter arvalis]|uniref:Uncharacterized protein n=1 Tax=Conexibacter arvalis TaxID=912552 RepID=A0A840IED9_9ACTN|nr:hypothetical protein [Conexibacter arvalis]MBB4662300.1 hypothetical protein [Conexibacter arvalis]